MSDDSGGEDMDLRQPLMEGRQQQPLSSRRSTSSGETDNELELVVSSSPHTSVNGASVPRPKHVSISMPLTKSERQNVSVSPDTESSPGGAGENRETEQKKKRKERVTWGGVSEQSRYRRKPAAREARTSTLEVVDEIEGFDIHSTNYSLFDEGYVQRTRSQTHPRRDTQTSSEPVISVRGDSVTTRGSSLTDSYSEDGRVIDGRYSISAHDVPLDFVRVEVPLGGGDVSTTQNLERCKRKVLNPYLYFLKFIGWRRIRSSRHDLEAPRVVVVSNVVYPFVIWVLLAYVCVSQIVSCFSRIEPASQQIEQNDTLNVTCKDGLVTGLIIPDILLLTAYVFGLYIIRYAEPEHLARLIETVYLSYTGMHASSQKKLTWTLQAFLAGGFVWVLFSCMISIMRVFSLQLLCNNTRLDFLTDGDNDNYSTAERILQFVFVLSSLIGFILFDLLYVAVVINYASQCQLLIFYIENTITKVYTKAYRLGDAIKEMSQLYEFLTVLNGKLASLTSLCLYIFIQALLSSIYELTQLNKDEKPYILDLGVVVGVCNIVQWAFLTAVPLIQAARLTSACSKLRRLGLYIASRPYIYSDTPQLILDSFLQYTNATRYRAKLVSVPVYPFWVVGGIFMVSVLALWTIFTFPVFHFVEWF